MISMIILAIFKLALPVGLVAYLLVGWMLDSGKLDAFTSRKELDASLKAYRKEGKKEKRKEENIALKKWMTFGGGFYGTAALYTYAYIEFGEMLSFFGKVVALLDFETWVIPDLFELIIGFIINSIMNFIDAILWFVYWDIGDDGFAVPIVFIAAYGGYLLGARLANQHAAAGVGHVQAWRWIAERRGGKLDTAGE